MRIEIYYQRTFRDYSWYRCSNLSWLLCHNDDLGTLVSCGFLESAENIKKAIEEQTNLSVAVSERENRYNIRMLFDNDEDEAEFIMREYSND